MLKMRKRVFALMAACVLLLTLSASALAATKTGEFIGVEAAKAAALKQAGAVAKDATFLKAKLDRDDGRYEYEVKFTWNDVRYECDIDAKDGTILSYCEKIKQSSGTKTSGGKIGVEKAKIIALDHAGITAADVDFEKAKLDRDDGRYRYEVEFRFNHAEYEFEIDAYTGTILDYEYELKKK